jgi:hypothetical protein
MHPPAAEGSVPPVPATAVSRSFSGAPISTEAALELFDRLDPVDEAFMLGAWRGSSFATGHPIDGLLELYHWHGKRFDSAEDVHPLVFRRADGRLCSLEPRLLTPFLPWAGRLPGQRSALMGSLFQALIPLLATQHSRARLRITSHRGVDSATMVYDHAPINDVFRRADGNTVLGLMDCKGMERPFFFLLRRDETPAAISGGPDALAVTGRDTAPPTGTEAPR